MNKQELLNLVDSLELPKNEYYILSSGCLLLYGLREKANDLDLCITQNLFNKLKDKYNLDEKDRNECCFYKINDLIEVVVTGKFPYEYDIKDGYPVQKLEMILKSKQNSNREKDKKDVVNITKYLEKIKMYYN